MPPSMNSDGDDLTCNAQFFIWFIAIVLFVVIVMVGFFIDSLFSSMRGANSDSRKGALANSLLQILFMGLISYLIIQALRRWAPEEFSKTFLVPACVSILIMTQWTLMRNIYKAVAVPDSWMGKLRRAEA